MSSRLLQPAAVLAVILLNGLLWLVAELSPTAATAAETGYLAFWAALVLVPATALATACSPTLATAATVLGVVACLPGLGGARAAAFGAILAAAVVTLAAEALARGVLFEPARAVGATLALQALFRADRILELELGAGLVTFLALPVVAGLAAAWLASETRPLVAAGAVAAAFVLGPGLGVLAVASLVVAAAAAAERRPAGLRAAVILAALLVAALRDPVWPAILATSFVAVALDGRPRWQAGPAVLLFAASLAAPGPISPPAVWLLPLVAAVPAVVVLAATAPTMAIAVLFTSAASYQLLGITAALVPPLIAGLCILPTRQGVDRAQLAWTSVVLATSAAAAAYPWLRPAPLGVTMELLVPTAGWPATIVALAAFGLLTVGAEKRAVPPLAAATALAVVGVVLGLGRPPDALSEPAFTLSSERPNRRVTLPDGFAAEVLVVDGFLSNSSGLASPDPVADLVLHLPGGGLRVRSLRPGVDTADWSAPPPELSVWRATVAADGASFTAVYRLRWVLGDLVEPTGFTLSRRRSLPPDLEIGVERIFAYR